jgi:hypothetical protein
MNLLINFAAFQLGWFATVLGGANNLAWAGTLAAMAVVALHLWRVPNRRNELLLVAVVGAIGATWDSALVALGITYYPSGILIDNTAPHWIVAMWMLFATTLNVSMRWMRGRWWLAVASGAVFGPLAFYAGHQLGGVAFPDFWLAMFVLSAGWAIFMPVLMALGQKFDGTEGQLRTAPVLSRQKLA